MQHLTIVRGLPGSGKSTYAHDLASTTDFVHHFEADDYFETVDGYVFDPKLLNYAHQWCLSSVVAALRDGYDVIVSNTFTQLWELEKYIDLQDVIPDLTISIVEMRTQYQNVHGVPEKKLEIMRKRWENIPESFQFEVKVIE